MTTKEPLMTATTATAVSRRRALSAAEIDAATPATRNRYADALRLVAISVVVVGHWLMAVVTVDGGDLGGSTLLVEVPATRWLTWVLQVMPLFFFVGGYANAAAYGAATGRGTGAVDWVRGRARRLMRPIVPLLVLWVPAVGLLAYLGVPGDILRLGSQNVIIPAWFLATYLVVVAFAPLTYRLHRRHGVRVLAVLVALAAAVDIAHIAGVPIIGYTNFLWVWGAIHQAGYFWRDGRLPVRVSRALAVAATGFAVLALLVTVAGYPVSMVGVDGAARTNNFPPTVALIALGCGQMGLALALRRPAELLLARPKVWAGVVKAGAVTMTVYLWHMTAMVTAAGILYPTGIWPATDGVNASWWLQRPLWIALLAVILAVHVRLFARFEQAGPVRPRPSTARALAGIGATVVGLTALVLGGLYDSETGLPLEWLALLAAGLGLLGVLRPPARRGTTPPTPAPAGSAPVAAARRS